MLHGKGCVLGTQLRRFSNGGTAKDRGKKKSLRTRGGALEREMKAHERVSAMAMHDHSSFRAFVVHPSTEERPYLHKKKLCLTPTQLHRHKFGFWKTINVVIVFFFIKKIIVEKKWKRKRKRWTIPDIFNVNKGIYIYILCMAAMGAFFFATDK